MTKPKLLRLSRARSDGNAVEPERPLTEAELAGFVNALVSFERAQSDRRSDSDASPEPDFASLEALRVTPAGKRPLAIKSE